MSSERGNFGTKMGVILATAGSAVGLGNIWRFPYMTGQDGGAAFIILYFVCVIMLGIPGMLCEFIIGRHSSANAARAYSRMEEESRQEREPGGTRGRLLRKVRGASMIGYMGIITSMIILGFYAVVAGWCLQYLFASVMGEVQGNASYVQEYFVSFSTDAWRPLLWTVAFILGTHFVVVHGVRNGIERASNLLMPTLFILLIVIVVAACSLPGAGKGIEFLLKPDFSKMTHSVMLEALGQAFFSLSLGTACLCTYASYFSRQTNLLKSAVQIALVDSLIAILAGLMIFPAAFSVGVNPDSGPSLIFITLPNVFQQAFAAVPVVGYVIGILFYGLLALAALTSTISMHEIGTAFFYEELHITRRQGAWIETIVCSVIGIFCSLSMGAVDSLKLFGMEFLNFCDYLTAQILLPFGSLLTCLFVGWYVPRHIIRNEFTNWGTLRSTFFSAWLFVVRYVCPLCILAIFLHQFGII
ncbi:MAG: sodium-dependent transporter [Prevotella sp.]|nr:sodium-dependent transporter [Prevotella sp.]